MSEKNREIVGQVNAAFEAGDMEEFLDCCADDVKWTMAGEKSIEGKDPIRQFMSSEAGTAPPQITNKGIVAEGDSVAAYGEMTMSDKNGKSVAYAYCDVYRFRDAKIAELTSYCVKNKAE